MPRKPYRSRLKLLVDLWDIVLKTGPSSREEVVEMLRRMYSQARVEPLRGKARPQDLYDKEMASLYVVGRYGLGLYDEYTGLFDKVFWKELVYEDMAEKIREGDREAFERLAGRVGGIDQNTIARMLRVFFTKLVYGFADENDFIELLRRTSEILPDYAETIRKYSRFYIAFRVAEAIASSRVRDKMGKEAFKQALGIKIGLEKITPDDDYIASIARDVFKVSRKKLEAVLGSANRPTK